MSAMKTMKGFPIMTGLVALASITLLYVCFVYLKQMPAYAVNVMANKNILGEDMIFDKCPISDAQPLNNRSHFPRPTTYNRFLSAFSTSIFSCHS